MAVIDNFTELFSFTCKISSTWQLTGNTLVAQNLRSDILWSHGIFSKQLQTVLRTDKELLFYLGYLT